MTIETARRASLEFVCVFGQDAFAPSYNEVTAEIARVHALPLIDLYHDFKNRKSFFQDESHFTAEGVPWCTTPIEAESSLGPDSHHPIISLSGIPSVVMVLRILHPILASPLCAANPLARIAEPTIAL